jgi:DNA-binding MarR family transcriptional regulator
MIESKDPLSDQVFHRFLSLLHHSRRYARQLLDESGLTPRDFSVLRYLLESGTASVGQVQAFIHRSFSTTSSLITQLEERGYVTRTRSREDNRVVIVELTALGRQSAENTPMGGLPLLRRHLSQLTQEQLIEIDSVLSEITRMMEVIEIE